ncbi:uncharacterized protein CC84DRAFT_1219996 [Paraphaeosphaeria sporulosa]|uniref:Mid2 domain-containing protein n=1 Tax=Paraphaeosphaeria sporulosa TaxID=1460663 RepID=A0A177C8A9_9PLEO|nr:uncharacterized protein CC84DRAFT_1219996 [Paraphaeosphaeria sporulosa]OAG03089.1 hypothetical protein CC84DRAFT_1219996 [Paraphaeosphaeria sporulosa]
MASLKALLGFALYFLVHTSFASNIATFEDAKCKDSKENINGPNGYPNGTCTRIDKKGAYKSFQVVGLDEGCSVTLYGKDSDPKSSCSSQTQLEFPRIGACYNASWVYFSIDFCDPPETRSSSTTLHVTSTPAASSTSSTTLTSTSATTPNSTPKTSRKGNTGAIAGGIVGGAVALALVVALVIFSVKRNRRLQEEAQGHAPGTAPEELPTQDVKHEIYSHEASLPPQEIGRNSVYIPPSELHSNAMKGGAEPGPAIDVKA